MTSKIILRAIKTPKPAIISEKGVPRYVMLDWETYEQIEDLQDRLRLMDSLTDPKNQIRIPYSQVKKLLHF